jgi:hypothetical protein
MNVKLIGCIVVIATGAMTAQAQFVWMTNNNEIMITDNTDSIVGNLVIPSTITGLPVTAIGQSAFYNEGALTNVVIPDSVRQIGDTAFAFCGQLQTVTLGAGVTNLGYHWVATSSRLSIITVSPGNPVFESSGGVLFSKGQQTLVLCPPQQGGSYVVPSTVKNIGAGAFDHAAITGVTVPSSVTNIATGAFYSCTTLRDLTFNEGLRQIENLGFYGCTALTTLVLPQSATNIFGAFQFCGGMTNVSLGTNLVEMGGAFEWCDHLPSIQVPEKVTDLGDLTFAGCTRLSQAGLPTGLVRIGRGAFSQCAITNIALPNGLKTIEPYAFEFCAQLQISTVPNTVTNIDQFAFRECYSIGHMDIPASVLRLGESVFNHCINLGSVNIGKGLNTVVLTPFSSCGALTDITVDPQNATFSSLDGVMFDKNRTQLVCCPNGKIGTYRVPTGVQSINYWAFNGTSLSKVILPNTVTSIATGAFNACNNLVSIWFEGNAPTVAYYGLAGATKATIFYFPQTSGWTDNLDGRPIQLWNAWVGAPTLAGSSMRLALNGSTNLTVILESQDGLEGAWTARQTNTLYNGVEWFIDPNWTNSAKRFYRLRAP